METIEEFKNKIICGDCLEVMKTFPDNSVDSIVTDPPYELGFMGKSWDNTGIANNKEMWKECLRVLKPGAYLLSFGGTRTYHRMASAIEDAGFEVRDMIEWVYGSGFPKSLNVAKMIEGKLVLGSANTTAFKHLKGEREKIINGYTKMEFMQGNKPANYNNTDNGGSVTKPEFTTEQAKQWEGWGTAMKPAHEPICMARKPLAEKTVAENVLKYGTGGINIDESRVETTEETRRAKSGWQDNGYVGGEYDNKKYDAFKERENNGRFPANLIHDGSEEVRECFPETKSGKAGIRTSDGFNDGIYGKGMGIKAGQSNGEFGDSGNASSFFKSIIYQAKASKSERNMGCDGLEEKQYSYDGRNKEIENPYQRNKSLASNNHPTVKPIALMEYLIKMVTPKGGLVLDPFVGSGTTAVASKRLGYKYIGIEMIEEYCKIANERLTKLNDGIPPRPKDLGVLPTTI